MAKKEIVNAHCNECAGERKHLVLRKLTKPGDDDLGGGNSISWSDTYRIIECQGCESIKVLHTSWFSEDWGDDGNPIVRSNYFPPSIFRKAPHWIKNLENEWYLTKLLAEIYRALQNEAPALAAMGIRAAVEAIAVDKVGDRGSFAENLKQLQLQAFITDAQAIAINVPLELGHASIHRGHLPNAEQLETALDVLEHLIHGLYILAPKASEHVKSIPKRST